MVRIVLWAVGVLGAIGLILYWLVIDVWVVPGDDPLFTASVKPTLEPGDVVLLSRHGGLDHGYLARCPDPDAAGRFVVARAIAHTGETVSFDQEIVSIDGHHTPSPRGCEPGTMVVHDPNSNEDVKLACEVEEFGEVNFNVLQAIGGAKASTKVTVEPGQWFLVSDDRHVHLDSRDFGQMSARGCEHVLFRVARGGQVSLGVLW